MFSGNVTVNGDPAPVDTVVTGRIVNSTGGGNWTVVEPGKYGDPELHDYLIIVAASGDDVGKAIEFYVKRPSDTEEIEANQTAIFDSDDHQLDLSVVKEASPSPTASPTATGPTASPGGAGAMPIAAVIGIVVVVAAALILVGLRMKKS
jgi:hypothetical protein